MCPIPRDAAYASITEALEINIDAWPEGHRTTAQSRLTAALVRQLSKLTSNR